MRRGEEREYEAAYQSSTSHSPSPLFGSEREKGEEDKKRKGRKALEAEAIIMGQKEEERKRRHRAKIKTFDDKNKTNTS